MLYKSSRLFLIPACCCNEHSPPDQPTHFAPFIERDIDGGQWLLTQDCNVDCTACGEGIWLSLTLHIELEPFGDERHGMLPEVRPDHWIVMERGHQIQHAVVQEWRG